METEKREEKKLAERSSRRGLDRLSSRRRAAFSPPFARLMQSPFPFLSLSRFFLDIFRPFSVFSFSLAHNVIYMPMNKVRQGSAKSETPLMREPYYCVLVSFCLFSLFPLTPLFPYSLILSPSSLLSLSLCFILYLSLSLSLSLVGVSRELSIQRPCARVQSLR